MKRLYIEFYGLPGSGKSTLSHIVAKRLRSEGHSVGEPSYDIDHQHPLSKRIKKFAVGCYWFVFHHKEFRHVWVIVSQNGYKGMMAFKQAVNVIQKIRIYNNQQLEEIVIMDQGLIQATVSQSMTGIISAKDNYEKLIRLMPGATDSLRIYIDVDDETAIDRMNKRISNDSRVEKLRDHSSKKEMLERIRKELISIREKLQSIGNEYIIISSNDIKGDADAVFAAIKKNAE